MGSATIASPVPIVPSNSLRRIIGSPCHVAVSSRQGASAVPAGAPEKSPSPLTWRCHPTEGAPAGGWKNYRVGGENLHGKTYARAGKIYRVSPASAGVREGAKRRGLSLSPAVGHDTERLDEALPAARERDRRPQVDDLILREVGAELVVERGVDDRMLARESVRQTQRSLRAIGQVGALVVGELRDQVLRRAPAHRRGRAREASVHALVGPRELDADQLEQLGL